MWSTPTFDTDLYHLITAFLIYSVLGWLVESIYMSFCNKKITNRGFAKGPFCPIYGFGALIGYLVLHPLENNLVALYFVGAISATFFEFLVGIGMKKFLGEVWWDYNEKPCNYKGIICLESTIAWGFYALIVICFLHKQVMTLVDKYQFGFRKYLICAVLLYIALDYAVQLCKVFNINLKEKREKIIDKYMSFKARWY